LIYFYDIVLWHGFAFLWRIVGLRIPCIGIGIGVASRFASWFGLASVDTFLHFSALKSCAMAEYQVSIFSNDTFILHPTFDGEHLFSREQGKGY